MDNIKLDIDGKHWMNINDIKAYYLKNKNHLKKFKFAFAESGIVTLVANYSGWCTVISENTGAIINCWAEELILQ